jgi:adenylosuccinate lyase
LVISSLDSRYASRLDRLPDIVGEENLVHCMANWSLAYAECMHPNVYLPQYTDKQELYKRVCQKELATKHQIVALLQVLGEDNPGITFHFGLTSEDCIHNARWTMVTQVIEAINEASREIETGIREYERQVPFPLLGHTHGQPATPIFLGPYLRAKSKRLGLVKPEFRLGGSNGQLTALKLATGMTDPQVLSQSWMRKMEKIYPELRGCPIITPTSKVGLLQVGPSNEATLLSAMAFSLKLRALARSLWDHCQRKILRGISGSKQAGSSAMPHKVNPINAENAEGSFTIAYSIFENVLQANADSRGLRDLSNSVINRNMFDGWCYLYLGVKNLVEFINKSTYDQEAIIQELKDNPECLTEIYRYYLQVVKGLADPYWELKKKPPVNFIETISDMPEWDRLWPKNLLN